MKPLGTGVLPAPSRWAGLMGDGLRGAQVSQGEWMGSYIMATQAPFALESS